MPQNNLDPSWAWGVSHAVDVGMSLGKDIVFTYGPMANLYTWVYSEKNDTIYFLLTFYIALAMYYGMISLFLDRCQVVPVLMLALVIALFGYNRDAFFMAMPVIAIFNLIGANLEGESFGRRRLYAVLALLPAFGILPLIKLSFSVICAFSALVGIGLLVRQRYYKIIALFVLVPAFTLLGLWVLIGQQLSFLPLYALNALPIISGYTEAMASYSNGVLAAVAVLGGVVLLYGIVTTKRLSKALAIVTAVLGSAYLFLIFKAGFVRSDGGHVVMTGIGVMVLALLAWPLLESVRAFGAMAIALITGSLVAFLGLNTTPLALTSYFVSRADVSINGVLVRIADPEKLVADFEDARQVIAKNDPVPKLDGPTDIYSYGQAALLASDNQWSPRPILQSYSAYTPSLLKENADFLQSKRAPKNIVFSIEPIDGRLPTLEDGASWPELFTQYEPLVVAGQRVILTRNRNPVPSLVQLGQVDSRLGQPIKVPVFDGQVYMTAIVKPSIFGKLWSLLFKPSYLLGRVTYKSGQILDYRVISGMMQTPFMVSPVIDNWKEFLSLYSAPGLVDSKRVDTIAIYSPKPNDRGWLDAISVTFYGMPNPNSERALQLLDLQRPQVTTLPEIGQCVGSLDAINGWPVGNGTAEISKYLSVRGWNTIELTSNMDHIRHIAFLEGEQGAFVVSLKSDLRADVAEYFKKPQMRMAGYSSIIDLTGLRGHYKLTMGIEQNGHILKCPQPPVDILIR